jgi:hypothetical protein
LDRRIAEIETLRREIDVWERERNQKKATVKWQFKTTDARTKLQRLYPSKLLS